MRRSEPRKVSINSLALIYLSGTPICLSQYTFGAQTLNPALYLELSLMLNSFGHARINICLFTSMSICMCRNDRLQLFLEWLYVFHVLTLSI